MPSQTYRWGGVRHRVDQEGQQRIGRQNPRLDPTQEGEVAQYAAHLCKSWFDETEARERL